MRMDIEIMVFVNYFCTSRFPYSFSFFLCTREVLLEDRSSQTYFQLVIFAIPDVFILLVC